MCFTLLQRNILLNVCARARARACVCVCVLINFFLLMWDYFRRKLNAFLCEHIYVSALNTVQILTFKRKNVTYRNSYYQSVQTDKSWTTAKDRLNFADINPKKSVRFIHDKIFPEFHSLKIFLLTLYLRYPCLYIYAYVCVCVCVCVCTFTNHAARAGCDTKSIF